MKVNCYYYLIVALVNGSYSFLFVLGGCVGNFGTLSLFQRLSMPIVFEFNLIGEVDSNLGEV